MSEVRSMRSRREMKRVIVLGAVLVVGAASLVVTEAEQGGPVVEVERLKENLYVLRGGGGNSAAFVTSDGVVLVDTKVAGWGQPLIDRIAELTPNPVTTIINTHAHFDHVSGNVEFPASVEVVAHTNARRLMEEWNPVTGFPGDFPNVFQTSGGQGLPTRTYDDRLTLGGGDDQVDLYYFGRGHTGGDTWVVFPSLRVMHAGDMFPGRQVPIMDASNGGSGVEYARSLRNAYQTVTDIDLIITGHSTQMTRSDLAQMAAFVDTFVADVREAKEAGRSAAEVAASWEVPAEFSGFGSPGPERLEAYVQVIFDELE
ncbi:MAG: MBL fold metallo-hydrolase [Acidobacteria bacterium]|nr:MBL fold metallo-hydrolase [Acidobacteriota bacterium]